MVSKRVVLPEPFGPIRPRISPCRTSNETSVRACWSPYHLVMPATSSSAASITCFNRFAFLPLPWCPSVRGSERLLRCSYLSPSHQEFGLAIGSLVFKVRSPFTHLVSVQITQQIKPTTPI